VRKVVRTVVDRDSYFPIKERFARNLTTGLARLNGRSVGVIAPNPMFKGGALDSDACDKAISFITLCDSFRAKQTSLVTRSVCEQQNSGCATRLLELGRIQKEVGSIGENRSVLCTRYDIAGDKAPGRCRTRHQQSCWSTPLNP